MGASITITWLGHACFKVEAEGYAIVIDPYIGVPGYEALKTRANQILCSHGHGDHSHQAAVSIVPAFKPSPFKVSRIDCFHDDRWGELRGTNIIHVLDAGGLRVAHFGDLGHDPSPSDIDQLGLCHAVMVPVGGHYTIGPQAARALKAALAPRVFIPMHDRRGPLGFDVLATLEDFLALVDDVTHYPGNSMAITADTPAQTAVLRYTHP